MTLRSFDAVTCVTTKMVRTTIQGDEHCRNSYKLAAAAAGNIHSLAGNIHSFNIHSLGGNMTAGVCQALSRLPACYLQVSETVMRHNSRYLDLSISARAASTLRPKG
mmetsp:Transcript_17588/g.30761  ORF Transcript_17588/g.30761 Transcript_17588/m.30761 type:complete len:107 (+) Transcript_17588:87-407(+)